MVYEKTARLVLGICSGRVPRAFDTGRAGDRSDSQLTDELNGMAGAQGTGVQDVWCATPGRGPIVRCGILSLHTSFCHAILVSGKHKQLEHPVRRLCADWRDRG